MYETCIIIPCFNEEKRIRLEKFKTALRDNSQLHFCFVNDKSEDNTYDAIKSCFIEENRVKLISNPENLGKAESIRRGIHESAQWKEFHFFGYLDADLSTSLEELMNLYKVITGERKCMMVLGSRIKKLGSKIERSIFRHYAGRLFTVFSRILFRIDVFDSQCGAKIFSREIIKIAFDDPFVSRWFFDVELIIRILSDPQYRNRDALMEVPLNEWIDVKGSKVKPFDFIKTPFELLRIYFHYKNRKML